jgi:prepilin-type N-terminal cleavage/methylation domain-containing protein
MTHDRSSSNLAAAANGVLAPFRGRARCAARDMRRPAPGRGFTLVEVVLVLTIIVVIGALMLPVMTGAFARSQLRNGGEIVRTAWAKARLAAMETGQTHLFRCQLKTRQFQIISVADLVATSGAGTQPVGQMVNQTDNQPFDVGTVEKGSSSWRLDATQLPSGIMFATGQFAPSEQMAAMFSGYISSEWAGPIVFHPDGTTTDASLLLSNPGELTIRVTLRGITGTAHLGEVDKEAFQ